MLMYDQIMTYYADDEEFQKRAQTRWKYFEREGYRKLSDILPVDDYADKVEKYALYYYLANYDYLDERKQEATTRGCNLHEEVVDALEIIEPYRDKLTRNNFVLY